MAYWSFNERRMFDCPYPLADFVKNIDTLQAIDSIGIASDGGVGSVLLFGDRPIEEMRDVAVPTDSSTSRTLLPGFFLDAVVNLD